MINNLELKNFGPLEAVRWKDLGPINLVIGGNGSGKTFLLKSLYCAMRTLEEYKRGDDQRSAAEILAEKPTHRTYPFQEANVTHCSATPRDHGGRMTGGPEGSRSCPS